MYLLLFYEKEIQYDEKTFIFKHQWIVITNNYVEPIALWIFVNELHFSKTLRQLLSNKKYLNV